MKCLNYTINHAYDWHNDLSFSKTPLCLNSNSSSNRLLTNFKLQNVWSINISWLSIFRFWGIFVFRVSTEMPIIVLKDYEWRQTDDCVIVQVDVKVPPKNVDLVVIDDYMKVQILILCFDFSCWL